MYVLHYAPDNASLIIRIVLEQAGLPYRTALVDRSTRQQESAAYMRLNPAGLIPTLETQHGPISETAAILLWLADLHHLAPAHDHPDRPAMLKWLFFLSNTAHADLRQIFYPTLYTPIQSIGGHHDLLSNRMLRHFGLLERAACDHPQIFPAKGILTPYVAALLRWSLLYPVKQPEWLHLAQYPTLLKLCHALEQTTAARTVARAEGLGDAPFTNPCLPCPPEGTAI